MTTATGPPPQSQDAPDRDIPECPYVGLVPFDEKDAAYFFGRECESDLIIANLTASRLTLLYAPSGVGKSSVLRAGVLPQLHHMDEDGYNDLGIPGAAVAYVSTWRDAPLENIAAAVRDAVSHVTGASPVKGPVEEAPRAHTLSVAWLREVLRQSRVSTIYLILDQFEEYCLYHPADRGEEGLTAELGRILSAPDLPVHVLLSIREDALAGLDRFEGRVPHLFDNYLRLTHLSREAAQAAIECPLDRYNRVVPPDRTMSVEHGLITALLDQVRTGRVRVTPEGTAPDGFASDAPSSDDRGDIETPYLQLVLTRLWDAERATGSSSLRQRTLDDLGGAQTIVQTHLDNVMAGLSPAQVDVAAAVFHHLVTTSGAKIALPAEDLADWAGLQASSVQDLLETLCAGPQRILRPLPPAADVGGPPRYEIFHDVMGPAVLDWRRRYRAQQQQAESSRRLVAEREEAQGTARIARRQLRRTQLVAMSMAVMLIGAIVFGALYYLKKRDAEQEQFLARAANAVNSIDSLKDAVNAYDVKADARARSAVLTAASRPRSQLVAGPKPMIIGMILTPDARRVVAYGAHGDIRVFGVDGVEEHEHQVDELGLRGTITPSVWAVAVNPDASRVALGTNQGTVAVINTTTKQHVEIDTEARSTPTAVKWIGPAANGLILVVSGSGVATTHNPETGEQVARFPGVVHDALPLADGQHILTSEQDGKLRVWDARTAAQIKESSTLTAAPQFLRNYGQSVVGVIREFAESSIVVWDWRAGTDPVSHKFSYYNYILTVFVDERSQTISIAADKGVKIYRLTDGEELAGLPEQADWVNDVATSPDNEWITTAGADGRVLAWYEGLYELPARPTYELRAHRGAVTQVGVLDGGKVVMSLGIDGMVRRWELPPVPRFYHGNSVYDMDLSPDGSLLATAGADGRVFVFDFHDRSEASPATVSTGWPVVGVRLDPTEPNQFLILDAYGTAPDLWSWGEDGKTEHVRSYAKLPLGSDYLTSLVISPDGTTVACGDIRGTVHLWDTRTGELDTAREFRSTSPVYGVTFDPFSQLLVATGRDGVFVWELGTSKPPTQLPHSNATGVAFDPSGKFLVSTAQDRTVRVWARDGKLDRELVAQGNPSSKPSFSKDGGLLAVGTTDGLVEVWDVQSGVTVMLDRHHGGAVNGVVFLPHDRSRLMSASDDTTVARFDCPACSDQDSTIQEAIEWARAN